MREAMAKARQTSDLEWNEYQKAIDRITASGMASTLGALLTRLKDSGDHTVYRGVTSILMETHANPLVVKQAIYEWLYDHCKTCNGAKELKLDNGVINTCQTCNGAGVRRWDNAERALSLGLTLSDYLSRHQKAIPAVLETIKREVGRYSTQVKGKLE